MEDVQNQDTSAQVNPLQSTSFSVEPRSKNSNLKWILIFIGLLILGGTGIFFFTKSDSEPIPTATPSFNVTPIDDIATPNPTKSPEPAKKSEVSIEIQNGTGITGEAALLQNKLKALGYSDFEVGNASTTDHTNTVVTFNKTLSQAVQDELKIELEKIYKEVDVKTSSTQSTDVLIVTGLRISSATGTPSASIKATSSPKASATPTGN